MTANAMGARYPDLAGRTVFVSGGGSGIGAAFVRAFAGQGCNVAFVDIAEAPSRALATELGSSVAYWPCDVRDIGALKSAIADAAQGLRSDPRTRQQRGARRSAQVRRRDSRILGREPGRQPAASILRRAGGGAADAGRGRRLDHQSRLGVVDARDGPRSPGTRPPRRPSTGSRARSRASSARATSASTASSPARSPRRASARSGSRRNRSSGSSISNVSSSGCRRTTSRAPRCSSPPTRRAASPVRI